MSDFESDRLRGPQRGGPRTSRMCPLRDECAVHEELDCTGSQSGWVDAVRARERVDLESVAHAFGVKDPDRRRKAARLDATGVPGDCDCVVAVGPVDNDAVAAPVSCATADGASQVDIHARHVGSGQVVDGDRVRAAERVEVDLLDAGGVHRDGALDRGRT